MLPILIIDITAVDEVGFTLLNQKIKKAKFRSKRPNVLVCLDKFLKKNHLMLKKLGGLVLLEGGGTFSGVRLAAAILNTIHLAAGVKILGLDKRKYGDDWEKIFAAARKGLAKSKDGFIKPIYTGEPNITCSTNYK
jgi:Pyruvate/2-oxoacid:ferredoxin oxidoreductase gamma subunit